MTALIESQDYGSIRCLRLSRPPVNALNPDLCRALIAALGTAYGDGVRGLILAGAGKIFSAGLDVPYLVSLGDDRDALMDAWQAFFGAARLLAESRIPRQVEHHSRQRDQVRHPAPFGQSTRTGNTHRDYVGR